MSTMRDLMRIMEAGQPVPKLLFHGTSDEAWNEIKASGTMIDDTERSSGGICFTESRRVAEEFSRLACQKHWTEKGVVIEFDGPALTKAYALERFHDTDATSNPHWRVTNEHEWRIPASKAEGITRFVLGTYETSKDSYDDPAEWGVGADEWRKDG